MWRNQALSVGLFLAKVTTIYTRPNIAPKRVLMEFVKGDNNTDVCETNFILENEPGKYSDEAMKLLQPFYLKL